MKITLPFLFLIMSFNVFSHGGDDGPSSLEDEFSKLSHVHLPINYSTTHGLSFNYQIGGGHEETSHEEDSHGDETGLEVNIHPILFAGYDKMERLTSLEESSSHSTIIESSSENSPYILVENRKWDLGLGIGADIHLPNPLFVAGVGVTFLRGKNYYTVRNLHHKNEKRAPLLLPNSLENLENWEIGDQLAYATKGSMIFNAFVGIEPIIHIGPEYIHTGTYRFKAHLVEKNILEIQVMTTKTVSIGIEGSAFPFTFEMGKGKGHLNSLTYQFDLSARKSLHAINYLFNGRLDLTNKEMLASGGKIMLKSDMQNTSTSFSANFGLPAIYVNGGGQGTYGTNGTVEENEDGEMHVHEIFSTTFQRDRFTRGLLSNHKWENQSVISTVIRGDHPVLSSVFSWSLSREKMKESYLMNKIRQLAWLFGKPKMEEIEFKDSNLGYLKADFNINLSGKDVLTVLNGTTLKQFEARARDLLQKDFALQGHRSFCRLKRYQNCLNHYQNLISSKYEKLKHKRRALEKAYKEQRMNEVTSGLTDFVKVLFSSRYLTQAFMSHNNDLKVELRLEGENIKKHVLNF